VLNILGNALLTAAVVVAIANGHSRVYYSISEHGWAYLALSALALIFFTETLVYWIHRGLHCRFLYATLHKYHHEFRAPTSWASMAFHPLDSFAQAAPYHLFVFLFPTWLGLYAGALIAVTLWTFMIHDETLALLRGNIVNFTSHHVLHHACNKYNYGQFFTFWDRLANTHRAPQ
jgi:lathosterol oxidase